MSYYIYLFADRLVHFVPQTAYYVPVTDIPQVRWYLVHGEPPVPFDIMIQKQSYSFNSQKGFFELEGSLPQNWHERGAAVEKIRIWEHFNSLANSQKLKYTSNAVGDALKDVLILEEIREYRATGSIENCTILNSLLETAPNQYTPEGLVTKLWLKYESYRRVFAYLRQLEFSITNLLDEGKFNEAVEMINYELEKNRI